MLRSASPPDPLSEKESQTSIKNGELSVKQQAVLEAAFFRLFVPWLPLPFSERGPGGEAPVGVRNSSLIKLIDLTGARCRRGRSASSLSGGRRRRGGGRYPDGLLIGKLAYAQMRKLAAVAGFFDATEG